MGRAFSRWIGVASVLVFVGCGRGKAAPQAEEEAAATKASDREAPGQERGPELSGHAFPLLIWAAYTVEQEYFDKRRLDPPAQLLSAVQGLGLHTPEIFVERLPAALRVSVGAVRTDFSLEDVQTLEQAAARLEEILVFAQSVLLLEEEPLHELEYAAINGLFAPLDPHTILLTPEEHADLGVRTKGQFGGIGAEIRAEARRILVVRVLAGMPAEKAGVRGGDVILKIAGESTVNMSPTEAQQLLRGPVGTSVGIQVLRGTEVLTFTAERETIRIESVESQRLPDGVGYIRISNFQEDTADRVRAAFETLAGPESLRAVVFDLRGNAGGLLVQATAVVDQMVARGELVVVRSAMGREVDAAEPGMHLDAETAVVVLIDEASASAAEIVSGGVQALGRGVVLGRSSFGKGTVQIVRPASPYGRELALKLTIAEYRVAGDGQIQGRGVVPDLVLDPVELTRIAGVVRYFDLERFERHRERYRSAGLPSGKHEIESVVTGGAVAQLHYLHAPDPVVEKAVEDDALPAEVLDPEIRIAARIAGALAGTADPKQRRLRLVDAAALIAAEEDRRVRGALEGQGIDWSPRPDGAPEPRLSVHAKLLQEGPIRAGSPFTLEVEVRNEGDTPAYRVHAITDCVHDELDGIEVLLGTIPPQAVKRRRIQLHVMSWHPSFVDAINLDIHAGPPDPQPDAHTRVLFAVDGAVQPLLSFDTWIIDDPERGSRSPSRPPPEPGTGDNRAFQVRGNGDGMLQPGESVIVAFAGYNEGPGAATEVRALLRNLSGSQGLLEEGLFELGDLRPGQPERGAFGLTVSPDADPGLPLELDFVLGDAVVRAQARDKLRLRVLEQKEGDGVPGGGLLVALRDGIPLFRGAHAGSGVAARVTQGTVLRSVGQFGEFYGFDADAGRRLFARLEPGAWAPVQTRRADVTKLEMRRDVPDRVDWRPAVLPPRIQLEAFPLHTAADHVKLEGVATHPEGLRDVVVLVRPSGGSHVEQKVEYVAAPEGATSLAFEAEIPLTEGGNRILLIARDRAKVQRRVERWVFRDASFPTPSDAPSGGP